MELRRSQRVSLVVPMDVSWTGRGGADHREQAETVQVNDYGAMLSMKTPPPVSTEVKLVGRGRKKTARARVIRIDFRGQDGLTRFAVELAVPSYTFWGGSFPPAPPTGTPTG